MSEIPFMGSMIQAIKCGRKVETRRNSRYGKAGDILKIKGSPTLKIKLIWVLKQRLGDITMGEISAEGFSSKEEFKEIWKKLHPIKGWEPNHHVWVHRFELVKD